MASAILSRPFSNTEQHILDLYDQLRELQLQLTLLRARQEHQSATRGASLSERQQNVLDAKATLTLRDNVVESVMAVQPILNAVHNATHASPIERDLSSLIHDRDAAGIAAAKQQNEAQQAEEFLAKLELDVRQTSQRNAECANHILRLPKASYEPDREPAHETGRTQQIEVLENELKTSRQKWKVIKSVASAVVTGSGVDWARHERLRDMVLDLSAE